MLIPSTPRKPIRIWMEVGDRDLFNPNGCGRGSKARLLRTRRLPVYVTRTLVLTSVLVPALVAAQSQPRPTVIRASTVLDGKGAILRDAAIVVEGTRSVRIDSNVSAATYDLRGLTVMPGWIDTHTHIAAHFDRETDRVHSRQVDETPQQAMLYAAENAYKTFMAGFTTIQSPGAELDKDLRDWIAEGRIAGPRILTSLRAVTEATGNPSQIRAFVRTAIADGADF